MRSSSSFRRSGDRDVARYVAQSMTGARRVGIARLGQQVRPPRRGFSVLGVARVNGAQLHRVSARSCCWFQSMPLLTPILVPMLIRMYRHNRMYPHSFWTVCPQHSDHSKEFCIPIQSWRAYSVGECPRLWRHLSFTRRIRPAHLAVVAKLSCPGSSCGFGNTWQMRGASLALGQQKQMLCERGHFASTQSYFSTSSAGPLRQVRHLPGTLRCPTSPVADTGDTGIVTAIAAGREVEAAPDACAHTPTHAYPHAHARAHTHTGAAAIAGLAQRTL